MRLEDLACKDCGTAWTDPDGWGWLLKFDASNPGQEGKNRLLWVQCRACQSEEDRFAVSVASDIHGLPETS
jgi:hypothetical protein